MDPWFPKYKKYKHKYLTLKKQIGSAANDRQIENKTLDDLTMDGPIVLNQVRINKNLTVNGTLTYNDLSVNASTKIVGTVYGENGIFNAFDIIGQLNANTFKAARLLCKGDLNGDKMEVNKATINGLVYITNSTFRQIKILSYRIQLINCRIDVLIINNPDKSPERITVEKSNIGKIIVRGTPAIVWADQDSQVKKIVNGEIAIGTG